MASSDVRYGLTTVLAPDQGQCRNGHPCHLSGTVRSCSVGWCGYIGLPLVDVVIRVPKPTWDDFKAGILGNDSVVHEFIEAVGWQPEPSAPEVT